MRRRILPRAVLRCVCAAIMIAGCGPEIGSPSGEGGGSGDDESEGDDDTGTPDVPHEPGRTLCDADPYTLDPYPTPLLHCLRGLVEFTAFDSPSGGMRYTAYASFFTVLAEGGLGHEVEVIEPFDGTLDDCRLARNRLTPDDDGGAWVVPEDAGDVTFVLGDVEVAATEFETENLIGYWYETPSIEPPHLTPQGFVATGDAAPAIDLTDVLVLPERIELLAPELASGVVVDHDALVLRWVPSALDTPLDISLTVEPPGGAEWFELFCRADDDGEFTIPADFASQLPRPHDAKLYLARADRKIVGHDGERGISASATMLTSRDFTLR